jgi:heat shock protein HslJ
VPKLHMSTRCRRAIIRQIGRRQGKVFGCLILVAGLVAGSTIRTASAQGFPFPACPRPLAKAKWSAPETPTRAIAAQQWFKMLQAKVPAVSTPQALMALGANEPVVVCRVSSSSPATEGLGVHGDVEVVVVSKVAASSVEIEVVARFDSSRFEVYLPPSFTADASPEFMIGDMGPSWPVLTVGATNPSDQQLLDALMTDVFASATEIVAMRAFTPDQPGQTRTDRLLVGDACGTVGLHVRLESGALTIVSGTAPPCAVGSVRKMLVSGVNVSIDRAGRLKLASPAASPSRASVVLSKAPRFEASPNLVRSYREKGKANSLSSSIKLGSGALRSMDGSDGCNTVSTAIAFSSNRFVIDPFMVTTAKFCESVKANAFSEMLKNVSGTGTYVRRGSTLTLMFADKAVAVLSSAR